MRINALCLLLCLLLFLLTVGVAQAKAPLRAATAAELKSFDAMLQEGHRAAMRRDVKYLDGKLAPNFTVRSTTTRVVMTRAQYLVYIAKIYRAIVKYEKVVHKIVLLRFQEKRAFVTTLNGQAFVARDSKGKLRRVKSANRLNSVWISTPRGWLVESVVQTAERTFIDGRDVSPRARKTG